MPGIEFNVFFLYSLQGLTVVCSVCPHHTDFTFSHSPTYPLNSGPLVSSLLPALALHNHHPGVSFLLLLLLDSPGLHFPIVFILPVPLKLRLVPWISDQLSYPHSSTHHFRPSLP